MYIILSNTVDRAVVHEESDEGVKVDCVHMLAGLSKIAEFDLISHVVHFLLSGIVTHGSH